MDFALQVEPAAYEPAKAKQLLAEAGYPNGLDAGDVVPNPPFFITGEAMVNYLNAVGVRVRIRPMERAAFYVAWREKKLRGLFITGRGTLATRRAACRSSSRRRAAMRMEAIRTSTISPSSRRASATRAGARRSCTASSASPSSA